MGRECGARKSLLPANICANGVMFEFSMLVESLGDLERRSGISGISAPPASTSRSSKLRGRERMLKEL
jgi:hypothetical protein